MNIKNTIKALLQSKFGGVQLSAARIDAIAGRLEGKVTTEEELLQRMETLNEALPFADIAKEDDRVRSLEAAAKAKGEEKQEEKKPEEAETKSTDTEVLALLKEMRGEITALKGEKVVGDRRSSILAKLEGADKAYSDNVLEYFGYMNFADDEAFNKYLEKVGNDYTAHVQTTAESQLGKDAPFVSTGKDGKIAEASKDELDAAFQNL